MSAIATEQRIARKRKRILFSRWMVAVSALLLALLTADDFLYPRLAPIGGRSFNVGRNGLWLRDSWYLGKSTESSDELVARLKDHQIRYAHFHVRFIEKDGTLRYPETRKRLGG